MMISAVCKVCGNSSAADSFKLHHEYKKMVCPNCFSGRTKELHKREQEVQNKPEVKPPGWDKEDEYLEKLSKNRQEQNQTQFTKIPGTTDIKCLCFECKYSFKYDPFRKRPKHCPYCSAEIPKLRTFNLL